MLSDGDIGPTDSVDVSDPDQVTRFFVWHRDNGSVGLAFTAFDVSKQRTVVSYKEPQNLPHLHSYRAPDRCSGWC